MSPRRVAPIRKIRQVRGIVNPADLLELVSAKIDAKLGLQPGLLEDYVQHRCVCQKLKVGHNRDAALRRVRDTRCAQAAAQDEIGAHPCLMSDGFVVIGARVQDTAQVLLSEDHEVVNAFAYFEKPPLSRKTLARRLPIVL